MTQKPQPHTWQGVGYMNRTIERTGYRLGHFGIYKGGKGGWFVNHLPTGTGISQMDSRTMAEAVAKVHAVADIDLFDWSASDIGTIFKGCHNARRSPAEVIRTACQGV